MNKTSKIALHVLFSYIGFALFGLGCDFYRIYLDRYAVFGDKTNILLALIVGSPAGVLLLQVSCYKIRGLFSIICRFFMFVIACVILTAILFVVKYCILPLSIFAFPLLSGVFLSLLTIIWMDKHEALSKS
jgi:hypothetical protein